MLPVALVLELRGICVLRGRLAILEDDLRPSDHPDIESQVCRNPGLHSAHAYRHYPNYEISYASNTTRTTRSGQLRFEHYPDYEISSPVVEVQYFVPNVLACERRCRQQRERRGRAAPGGPDVSAPGGPDAGSML